MWKQFELDSKEIQAKNIQSLKHCFALASFRERPTSLNQKQFSGPFTHLGRPYNTPLSEKCLIFCHPPSGVLSSLWMYYCACVCVWGGEVLMYSTDRIGQQVTSTINALYYHCIFTLYYVTPIKKYIKHKLVWTHFPAMLRKPECIPKLDWSPFYKTNDVNSLALMRFRSIHIVASAAIQK